MHWTREGADGWIGYEDRLGLSCLVYFDPATGLWCWEVTADGETRPRDAGTETTEDDARGVAIDSMIQVAA